MTRSSLNIISTKQVEDGLAWAAEGDGEMLIRSIVAPPPERYPIDEAMYRRIACPVLLIHGADDTITPPDMSRKVAELTGGDLHILPGAGHAANARFPAWTNTVVRDFLSDKLGTWKPARRARAGRQKQALYLSSPIGLGHVRRHLGIARELRRLHPGLQIDWLAQDPVTRLLDASNERVHPASKRLASEVRHIEEEAGEHDLRCFEALRNMDEILIRNFMVFQEIVEIDAYDLVIADEAWEIDHFWHEHPQLKRAQLAWLTDFVGMVQAIHMRLRKRDRADPARSCLQFARRLTLSSPAPCNSSRQVLRIFVQATWQSPSTTAMAP